MLSIKSECLNRLIILGERHLRRVIDQCVEHYHFERNHQGLDNRLLVEPEAPRAGSAAVLCRQRVGGLLNFYRRAA